MEIGHFRSLAGLECPILLLIGDKMTKKVILLDVDGPLNPFNAKIAPEGYTAHRMHPTGFEYGKGLRVLLNPLHGPSLVSSGAEIVWATMWEADANVWIGPHLGFPPLPFIDWNDECKWTPGGLHYKTRRIASWMNENRKGMDFLWIDDECTKKDKEWLQERMGGKVSIMRIAPKIGLTEADFNEINHWAAN